MFDAAIIGTGPAGLSAAINLKLHALDIVWFGTPELSVKVDKSERIANYPGFPMITGAELNRKFIEHAKALELSPDNRTVTAVTAVKDRFMLLADNDIVEARAVILATGAVPPAGVIGERELLGHGVSYCATCDGFMYKDKTIAVFCGDRRYEHEVDYLAGMTKKVYLSVPYSGYETELSNIEPLSVPIKKVLGEKRVSGISLADGREIEVDGVFFLRNAVAYSALMPGLETDGAHIVVDRAMTTNKRGCFAAGDCTGRPYQIAKAIGEGNTAAHSLIDYLAELKGAATAAKE